MEEKFGHLLIEIFFHKHIYISPESELKTDFVPKSNKIGHPYVSLVAFIELMKGEFP